MPLVKKTRVNGGTIMTKFQRRQAIGKWMLVLPVVVVRLSIPLHWHTESCCGSGGDAGVYSRNDEIRPRHERAGVSVLAFVSGDHNAWVGGRSLHSLFHIT